MWTPRNSASFGQSAKRELLAGRTGPFFDKGTPPSELYVAAFSKDADATLFAAAGTADGEHAVQAFAVSACVSK